MFTQFLKEIPFWVDPKVSKDINDVREVGLKTMHRIFVFDKMVQS